MPTITLLHIFPLKPILFLVCRNRQPLHAANYDGTLRRSEFLGQIVEIELQEGSLAGVVQASRVAGLGRLSAGAKMAMKPFVKRVFTIFATNA